MAGYHLCASVFSLILRTTSRNVQLLLCSNLPPASSFACFIPATQASSLCLQHTWHGPALEPLHGLCPLPGTPPRRFPQAPSSTHRTVPCIHLVLNTRLAQWSNTESGCEPLCDLSLCEMRSCTEQMLPSRYPGRSGVSARSRGCPQCGGEPVTLQKGLGPKRRPRWSTSQAGGTPGVETQPGGLGPTQGGSLEEASCSRKW